MSKKKVILSIILSLFALANVVLYLVFKNQYLDTLKYLYGLLNEPLPIVGVTTLAILLFLWQVLVHTKFGNIAINKIKKEYDEQKSEFDNQLKQNQELIEAQNAKIEELKDYIAKLCGIIRNKKVRELGEELNHGDDKAKEE